MDIAEKVRSGARWLALAKLVTQAYSWIVTIVVMRLLVPEDYALMAMTGVFISFIALFSELGLRVKLVQMKEAEYTVDYARSVFGLVLTTNLALVAVLAAASPLIAGFFGQERLVPIIVAMSVCLMITSLGSIPDALIKRKLDFRKVAIVDTLRGISASTATLVLASMNFGVWALVGGIFVGDVVSTLGLLTLSPFRAWPSFNFIGMKDTLQWGGLVVLQRLVWWAYNGLDSLLIGRFYNANALGIYATANQFATLPLDKVGQTLQLLSFTGLARVNDDVKAFSYYLHRATKLVSVVMFPIFFGIAAVAHEFAAVALGHKWLGLGAITAILAVSAPARCMNAVLLESINSLGKPNLNLQCLIVAAALFSIGILIGLPFGLMEIAIGVSVAAVAAFLYTARTACQQVGASLLSLLNELWPPTFAGLAMLSILLVFRSALPIKFPSLEGLLATIALGALIYASLILLLDRDGFRLALSLIRRNAVPQTRPTR